MTQEVLKLALDWAEAHGEIVFAGGGMSAVNKMNSWVAAIKEALAQEKALQALHNENERLGLYRDAYAQPEPLEQFCDSNCVWTDHHPDCKLAQPEQEPVNYEKLAALGWQSIECPFCGSAGAQAFPQRTEICCQQYDTCLKPCTPRGRHLAQRTWVGLTTADQKEIQRQSVYVEGAIRMTEAKLKERNT